MKRDWGGGTMEKQHGGSQLMALPPGHTVILLRSGSQAWLQIEITWEDFKINMSACTSPTDILN